MGCLKDGCRARLKANGVLRVAVCPECRSTNCLKCRAVHEGLSCRKYQMSIQRKESPGKRTTRNNNTGFSSLAAMVPEKPPRQAAATVAPPVAATDDDCSEKHVLCKAVGCDGQAFVDKGDDLFRCPLCGHYTCLKCEAVHESMTCAQYQHNKDNAVPTVHKPRRQSQEDSKEAHDEEKQEEPPADDDADGIIVECQHGNCTGYAYVVKTATMAQCELCKHWTCVSCKACHESQSCAEYKGIKIPVESSAPEPTGSWYQKQPGHNSQRKNGFCTEQELPAYIPHFDGRRGDYRFDAGMVSGARDNGGHKKVQGKQPKVSLYTEEASKPKEKCILPCDACCRHESDHTVQECEHNLCRKCIENSVEKAKVYGSVLCPAKAENSQPCSGHLHIEEVEQNVRREILKKLGRKSNWCDTQCFHKPCSHTFLRRKKAKRFICPMCRRENCAECQAVHEGMDCDTHIAKLVADMDSGKLEDPEEKKKRLEELTALYEQPSIETSEEFECTICLVEVEPGKGIVLKNCHHQICVQCLTDTAKNSTAAEVLCPCKSDDADCQMPVLDSDLRACLSKEDYAALQARGLREAENTSKEPSFHCKTPDCKGWCLYEREVEVFACPVCGQQNCLRCEAIHKDISCADYQADLKRKAENDATARASLNFLEEMLKTEQAMRCPQCGVVIIKRDGCDGMVCISCKTQLCWATKGARWGPAGKGDISGGCRCGVNGVKCHPRCAYCH